jgi:hypothetical protein
MPHIWSILEPVVQTALIELACQPVAVAGRLFRTLEKERCSIYERANECIYHERQGLLALPKVSSQLLALSRVVRSRPI